MVRDLRPEDIPVLKEIHARQGFGYPFPDLFSPEFVDVQVRVDEQDRPVMAVASRKTVEVYLFVDSTWRTPRWRMAALVEVHEVARKRLWEVFKIPSVHAWLPPEVEKAFGKRLNKVFGWVKCSWNAWCRETRES